MWRGLKDSGRQQYAGRMDNKRPRVILLEQIVEKFVPIITRRGVETDALLLFRTLSPTTVAEVGCSDSDLYPRRWARQLALLPDW